MAEVAQSLLQPRPLEPGDLPALVALNNQFEAELGLVTPDELAGFLRHAAFARALGPAGQPDAFVLCFDHQTPAQGPNHAWFLARRPRFLYVDRVAVAASARKRGLARALYASVEAEALRRGAPIICCEITSDPPNPISDAFHAALGFSEIGRAFVAERNKRVRYLEKRLE